MMDDAREALEQQALRMRSLRKERHRQDVIAKARKEFDERQRQREIKQRQFYAQYA